MPTDINAGVFAFLTSELGLLSFIKRSKLINENTKNITQDTIINNQEQKQIQQGAG